MSSKAIYRTRPIRCIFKANCGLQLYDDQTTGNVLRIQGRHKMSTRVLRDVLFGESSALRMYGPKYRFRPPSTARTVLRRTLSGNLVLVGSGDLTFVLRKPEKRHALHENVPAVAQSLPPCRRGRGARNPWPQLDELAALRPRAGITQDQRPRPSSDDRLSGPTTAPRPA